jgi:hypothetical protein
MRGNAENRGQGPGKAIRKFEQRGCDNFKADCRAKQQI